MGGTTYETHGKRRGFAVPKFYPDNPRLQLAFEKGFDSYVWSSPEDRNPENGLRRAKRRYSREYGISCFMQGWNRAAQMDKEMK